MQMSVQKQLPTNLMAAVLVMFIVLQLSAMPSPNFDFSSLKCPYFEVPGGSGRHIVHDPPGFDNVQYLA